MKRRHSDTIARHKLVLAIPIIFALLVSVAMAQRSHKSYQATTNIWADASIPNPSTVDTGTSGSTPSGNYQDVLTELLKTHAFLLNLANETPLSGYMKSHSPAQVDAALSSLPKDFTVTTPGPQLVSVAVKESTPQMATALAKALDDQFIRQVTDTLTARNQAVVDYDKQQLNDAQAALNSVQNQLLQYVQAHPSDANQLDSTANQLTGLVASAQQQYSTAQSHYNEAQVALDHVRNNSALGVFDPPSAATALSSKKTLLLTGGGAIVGGLMISVALLLYLTANDKTAHNESDIEDALSLRVVGTVTSISNRRLRRARTAGA